MLETGWMMILMKVSLMLVLVLMTMTPTEHSSQGTLWMGQCPLHGSPCPVQLSPIFHPGLRALGVRSAQLQLQPSEQTLLVLLWLATRPQGPRGGDGDSRVLPSGFLLRGGEVGETVSTSVPETVGGPTTITHEASDSLPDGACAFYDASS